MTKWFWRNLKKSYRLSKVEKIKKHTKMTLFRADFHHVRQWGFLKFYTFCIHFELVHENQQEKQWLFSHEQRKSLLKIQKTLISTRFFISEPFLRCCWKFIKTAIKTIIKSLVVFIQINNIKHSFHWYRSLNFNKKHFKAVKNTISHNFTTEEAIFGRL